MLGLKQRLRVKEWRLFSFRW